MRTEEEVRHHLTLVQAAMAEYEDGGHPGYAAALSWVLGDNA